MAIVDPELLATCPPAVVAANGMDAFTQLLESYVSIRANPMTDALAWSGMEAFRDGFFAAWEGGDGAAGQGRALAHGLCVAALGGLPWRRPGSDPCTASPRRSAPSFPIPHGLCCGTLVAEATDVNIRALQERDADSPALDKYARVGGLLAVTNIHDRSQGLAALVETLRNWTARLSLAGLGDYGMRAEDMARVVAGCRGGSMKTNPIVLTDAEVETIVARRL